MSKTITISIVIPHYNRVDFLKQTLSSVVYQTYENWEVIIVDDYSKPDCIDKIRAFIKDKPNIHIITKTTEPKGASVSRNIGLTKAVGHYVIFLDADDLLAPFALEQRIKVFEKSREVLDAVMAPTLLFSIWPGDYQKVWHRFDNRSNPLDSFINGNSYFHTMSGLWHKEFLIKIRGWDDDLSSYQDWEFHIRALLQNVRYKELQEYDNFYRMASDEQSIAANFFKEDIIKGRFKAFQAVFEQLKNLKKINFIQPFRIFVIRHLIQLIDHGKKPIVQELLRQRQLYGLNSWDTMLLKKMSADGHAWRYRRSTKFLTNILWRDLPFDPWLKPSLNKDLDKNNVKALDYNYQQLLKITINS